MSSPLDGAVPTASLVPTTEVCPHRLARQQPVQFLVERVAKF